MGSGLLLLFMIAGSIPVPGSGTSGMGSGLLLLFTCASSLLTGCTSGIPGIIE